MMNETQLAALAALSSGTAAAKPESKTIDYKISMANKAGDVKSVGIVKLWKRFNSYQMKQIVTVLVGDGKRVTIEELTGEAPTSNDEF